MLSNVDFAYVFAILYVNYIALAIDLFACLGDPTGHTVPYGR